MDRAESFNGLSIIDVLYLTNQDHIPSEIKQLFKLKKLSYQILPINNFSEVLNKLDLIGTVIVDTKDSIASQKQLSQIIELLEMNRISVILLSDRKKEAVNSSPLFPSKTGFSEGDSIDTWKASSSG